MLQCVTATTPDHYRQAYLPTSFLRSIWGVVVISKPLPDGAEQIVIFAPLRPWQKKHQEKSIFCLGLWNHRKCGELPTRLYFPKSCFAMVYKLRQHIQSVQSHFPPRYNHRQYYACFYVTWSLFITKIMIKNTRTIQMCNTICYLNMAALIYEYALELDIWMRSWKNVHSLSLSNCTSKNFSNGDIQKFDKALQYKELHCYIICNCKK